MHKCLYMLCPTDHLESVIRGRFRGQHFFLTSLGNTMDFDRDTVGQIAALVEKEKIKEITFILSEENDIVLDALCGQSFIGIQGLKKTYRFFLEQEEWAIKSWQSSNRHSIILSCQLNNRIKELRAGLENILALQPEINGKLYSRSCNSFKEIYPELLCNSSNCLN